MFVSKHASVRSHYGSYQDNKHSARVVFAECLDGPATVARRATEQLG
jgi:hypothetical protein